MTKGRNSTVISIRFPDKAVEGFRQQANLHGLSMSDFIKGLIYTGMEEIRDRKMMLEQNIDRFEGNEKYGKVGRNDPCPCGSGLKYKRCHGR